MQYQVIEHHTAGIQTGTTTKWSPIYAEELTNVFNEIFKLLNMSRRNFEIFSTKEVFYKSINEIIDKFLDNYFDIARCSIDEWNEYKSAWLANFNQVGEMKEFEQQVNWDKNEFIFEDDCGRLWVGTPNHINIGDSYLDILEIV